MKSKVFVVLLNSFLFIKCEDNSTLARNETQGTAVVSKEVSLQNNGTEGKRDGKQNSILDALTDVISVAAGAAAAAASSSFVDNVFGNQIYTTGEYCGYRRRHCNSYCRSSYRGPMRGYCRNGICSCQCDYQQCERYCRRFWDYGDYDHYDFAIDWDDDDHYDGHYDDHYDDHYDSDWDRRRYPIRAKTVAEADTEVKAVAEPDTKARQGKQLQGRGRAYCSSRGCRCDYRK